MFDWLYPYADKLRFPDEVIETQFRQDYHANTVSPTRPALLLELILYSLFGILDIYAIPFSKDMVSTRETCKLVRDEFECEYIGEITIKGRGKLEAWHLLAKKEERSLSHV
ncbi:MAG TPA: hypothetical protein VFS61_07030 [Anaerolineales bacterium]|nr:hypothetical protein [Anaerolineales bacterium]